MVFNKIQFTKLQRSIVLVFYANLIQESTYTLIHTYLNTFKSGDPLQSIIIKLLFGDLFSRKCTVTLPPKIVQMKKGVCK